MPDPAADRLVINDLLTRFFQAFDDHDWAMLRRCLCDEIFADYSSFRGVPAAMIAADDYVAQRRTALQALRTQHNFLNLRVEPGRPGTAAARCNYIIHRFHPSFDGANGRCFHSYGDYFFEFADAAGGWRISRITQHLLHNDGDKEIHGATRTPDRGDGGGSR
jgi:hypothetical protein